MMLRCNMCRTRITLIKLTTLCDGQTDLKTLLEDHHTITFDAMPIAGTDRLNFAREMSLGCLSIKREGMWR